MPATSAQSVGFDARALTIDGKRTFLLCGSMHYPRSTPAMWPKLIAQAREAGLNAIETYVFWNLHEPCRNTYDFAGRLDIRHFCELIRDAGMYLVLRIGPYICAEANYGGLPFWLRDIPGIQMRTENAPFQREMERWVRFLSAYLAPMFAPRGGPIILAQIENEYDLIAKTNGEAGQRYLRWSAELALSLDVGVPWVMCAGSVPGMIEGINSFNAADAIARHREVYPEQPLIWTEHWSAWYATYGNVPPRRDARALAAASARFVAAGGTGINYYMWHGGTNFGREGMYLQATSYDYDAPLDEFGRLTTKSQHLARLHHVLHHYADVLLADGEPAHEQLGGQQHQWRYGQGSEVLTFLCNDDRSQPWHTTVSGTTHILAPGGVVLIADDQVLFASDVIAPASIITRDAMAVPMPLQFAGVWTEPLPHNRPARLPPPILAVQPREQLGLTQDQSDYCWYVTALDLPESSEVTRLQIEGIADIAYIFIDGRFVASTTMHLHESRSYFDGSDFIQSVEIGLLRGHHTLAILCCAAGLIKGDWTIDDHNMVEERKGIWGAVRANGIALSGPWSLFPALVGEQIPLDAASAASVPWEMSIPATPSPLRWWRFTFERPQVDEALAVDLSGMTRGMAWLNGQSIGRYWLLPGIPQPVSDEKRAAGILPSSRHDVPTQANYHLPLAWLGETNELVLFDEFAGDPSRVRLIEPGSQV